MKWRWRLNKVLRPDGRRSKPFKLRRKEDKYNITMDNKKNTASWTIDQVLDPNSKFWDNMLGDMDIYLSTLDSEAIETLGSEPFHSRIADFITFFKSKAEQNQMVQDIEKVENVVTGTLWTLISEEDKLILFDNDIEYFSDWIDSCPRELLDIYITALSKGDSLNKIPKTELDLTGVIQKSNVSHDMCNVSVFNGKLILCSSNKNLLDNFKRVMLESGNTLQDYRTDKSSDNKITIHSYIFEIKENTKE